MATKQKEAEEETEAERREKITIRDNSNATKEYLGFEKRREMLNSWGTDWGIELDESEVDSLNYDLQERDLEAFLKKEFMANEDEYIEEISKEGVKEFIKFGETKYEDILLNQLEEITTEDIKRWYSQITED